MKRGTRNARMVQSVAQAAALFAVCFVASCSTQISPQELLGLVSLQQQAEKSPPPVPPTARQEPEVNSARIQAVQVDSADQLSSSKPAGSRISQIPSGPDTDSILRSAIDVDDPCFGELKNSEQCRSSLKPKSATADTADDDSMTLTVVAPNTGLKATFDAGRAVDEIGRGRTVSQGAQSAGSDFLSGSATPKIEPPVPNLLEPDLSPGAVIIQPQ